MRTTLRFDDLDEFVKRFAKLSNDWEDVTDKLVKQLGVEFMNFVKSKFLSGQVLKVRTGRLRSSIGTSTYLDYTTAYTKSISVGTNLKYALPTERGATIVPRKPGGALAVPIGHALTPTGAPRFSWRRRGDIPAQFPGLFKIKSKHGNVLLVRKERKRIVPYFVLVRRVTIPARWWLRNASIVYRQHSERIVRRWLSKIVYEEKK